MFEFITKRPLWLNLIAGFIVMVGLLFLLSLSLGPLTRHGKNKMVPNVVGKSYKEASKILDDAGFEVIIQDSIYSDTTAKGVVLKQLPDGDALVKISRTVYLTVNSYVPPLVEMPNLVGFTYRSAEMQLKNMGLKIGDTIYVQDFARNSVREQHYHNGSKIEPGTKIQQGSSIDLYLSSGIGEYEFTVPNLVGMTFGDAKNLLESNGLSFLVVKPDPDVIDTANAFVYMQNPSRMGTDGKRTKIKSGQTMDVWLSTNRPYIDTTNVQQPISQNQ